MNTFARFAFVMALLVTATPLTAQEMKNETEVGLESDISITTSTMGTLSAKTRAEVTEGKESDSDFIENRAEESENEDENEDEEEDDERDSNPDRPLVTGSVGAVVSVKAKEVRGWDIDQKQEFLATVKEAVEVKTGKELEHFAQGVLLKDENVESLSLNYGEIKMKYRQPARLLGVFPASLAAEASVSSDARVRVRFPWYRMFYWVPSSVKEVSLEGAVSANLESTADLSMQNAGAIAKALAVLSNVMKSHHDTAQSVIGSMR